MRQAYDYWQNQPDCYPLFLLLSLCARAKTKGHYSPARSRHTRDQEKPFRKHHTFQLPPKYMCFFFGVFSHSNFWRQRAALKQTPRLAWTIGTRAFKVSSQRALGLVLARVDRRSIAFAYEAAGLLEQSSELRMDDYLTFTPTFRSCGKF